MEHQANCEECGKPIEMEFSLCEYCELILHGTVSGQPVNSEESV